MTALDVKKLRSLVVAAQTGSLTVAAEKLGYTQSGLTHMMNALENDVGFPLLIRGHYGVKLTPEGEKLLPAIQSVLTGTEELERQIASINQATEETVRVAAYASIAMHWLPELIQRFRAEHPNANVDIRMGNVADVQRWVQEGKADMFFASRQETMEGEWIPLKKDPLLVILPRDDPSAGLPAYPVDKLDGKEFLMPSLGFRHDINRVFEQAHVTPQIRTIQVNDSIVISMVEHGLGVSILSELVLKGRRSEVLALPLDPPATRELGIGLLSRKNLPPMARKFLSQAQTMIAQMK
jgi:DNA-binding transcriptional LysR family regulator